MSGTTRCVALDVAELRKGMYVEAPDRPWTDLPFLLQGFTIENDEELGTFRRYCQSVYVDPERCAESFSESELVSGAGGGTSEGGHSGARKQGPSQREPIPEDRRYPDVEPLQHEVESAHRTRATARRFLTQAFEGANSQAGVDVGDAQSTITDLITRLTEHPTASLWLTSMNDHDDFTPTHSINVCVLVLSFCLRARIEQRKLEAIGMGTLLHDVGKSTLPSEMLNRPGPLDDEEWERVKHHPTEGYRILCDSGNVDRGALNIVRMHHERRDGRGYPQGLTQKDLPNYVLLAALANRYHALTSPRPYRSPRAPDRVLQSFYNRADDLYGSRAVEAFIRCVGIYPVGSLVELDNGALAVVVSSRPNTRLRPTVELVRTPDGEPYEKVVLLNLAAEAEREEGRQRRTPARKVRRVRSPADTGVDPGAVVARSFGVDIA